VVIATVFLVRDDEPSGDRAGIPTAQEVRTPRLADGPAPNEGGPGQGAEDAVPAARGDRPRLTERDESFPDVNATEEMQQRAYATLQDDWRRFLDDVPSLADDKRAKVLQILRDFQRTSRAALSTFDGDASEFMFEIVPDLWEDALRRAAETLTPPELRALQKRFRTAGLTAAIADRLLVDSPPARTVARDAM
jgi:hypothetical protein